MASRKSSIRRLWLAVHLYLGLSIGAIVAVAGVSGALLVFYVELDEILNPELTRIAQAKPRLSYEDLYRTLLRIAPETTTGWRLEIPAEPTRLPTARYYGAAEAEHSGFAPLIVAIDPYSGEVVKARYWGQFVMTWLYDLHYTLLLGGFGKILMAVVGGLLGVSLVSGVYLWWPPRHKWSTALSIKPNAGRERRIYDLHKVGGIYGLPVLLVLAVTGLALEIPEYVNPLIAQLSPLRETAKPNSNALPGLTRISVDRAVEIARRRFPSSSLRWIEMPHGAAGVYRINLHQEGEPGRRFPKTNVWLDQYSGEILAENDPVTFSAGDKLLSWLHPLHSGEALALPGRLLVALGGMVCPLLMVTGVMRWLQKRRARAGIGGK